MKFISEAVALMNSPSTPPAVKPIFQRFIRTIISAIPCVATGNVPCMRDDFKIVGVKGMAKGEKLSKGPMKQLFAKMLKTDQKAAAKLSALPKTAGKQAVSITNNTLNKKANSIQQYLQKLAKGKAKA